MSAGADPRYPRLTAHKGVPHLGVVFSRLLQTIKLQRDAFVWMDFNDRATGDAAILVAITRVLLALGGGASLLDLLNPLELVSMLVSALFAWLIYSGATYAIARFLFDGHGSYAFFLRVTGFAAPTLLLLIFFDIVLGSVDLPGIGSGLLVIALGAAWFVVIVANGITYIADLPLQKAFASAIGGYVVVVILQAILSGLRIF